MHKDIIPISLSKSSSNSFTLVELIIVIIIVGILAAVGMTQYSLIVEKGRTAEAKVRIGAMRTLAYQYYLENGTLTGMQDANVGVDNTCSSTDFYRYGSVFGGANVALIAYRCTTGGKTPNSSRLYWYYMQFYPSTGQSVWHCFYADDNSPCFGLPGCC